MSLKILLADDSMTAQNMGKKILTEAGYDVTTVSNGAAAVKKVTEIRPDILVLDIYMPGYNGLEVCEKVKASLDTARTPVLLTVGKMEPFRPEDGMRVKADGVIVKPFEATDLIAVVKKLAERVAPPAPVLEEGAPLTLPAVDSHHWADSSAAVSDDTAEVARKVEVPKEMAVIPAMGMELDEAPAESKPLHHEFQVAPPPPPPPPTAEFGVAAQFHAVPPPPPPMPAASVPEQEADEFATPAPAMEPGLEQFTRFSEQIVDAPAPDLEFTAAAPQDVTSEPIAELQSTIEDNLETADVTDPLLASGIEQQEMTTKFGVEETQEAVEETEKAPAAETESASSADLDDFEARLAAAMAAYEVPEQPVAEEVELGAAEPLDSSSVESGSPAAQPEMAQFASQNVEPPAKPESELLEPEPLSSESTASSFGADDIDTAIGAVFDAPDVQPASIAAAAGAGVPAETAPNLATPPSAPIGRTSFDDELTSVMERAAAVSQVYQAQPISRETKLEEEISFESDLEPDAVVIDGAVEVSHTAEPEPTVIESGSPADADGYGIPESQFNGSAQKLAEPEAACVPEPFVAPEVPSPSPESPLPAEESMTEPLKPAYPDGFPTPAMPAASAAAPEDAGVVADAIVDRVLDRMRPVLGVLVKELLRELKK